MADIKFDLLFGAKSSEAVIREIRKIASEFTNLDKMSKNIGKMGGGSQGLLGKLFSGGRDDFGKTLLGSEQATKRFTAVMAAASKSVEGDYAKSLDIARKKLADMSVATERLLKGQDLLNRTLSRAKQSGNIQEVGFIEDELGRGNGLIKRNTSGMRRLAGAIQKGDDELGRGSGSSLLGQIGGIGTIAAVAAAAGRAIYKDILESPNRLLKFEAEQGQRYTQQYMGVFNNDYSRMMAFDDINNDPAKRKDYERLGSHSRRLAYGVGGMLSGMMHWDINEFERGRLGQTGSAAIQDARNAQEQLEAARDPYRAQARSLAEQFRGALGTMRSLGIGGADQGKGHPSSGLLALNSIQRASPGFSFGEMGSAFGTIEGLGQRNGSLDLMHQALDAQAGGLTGAATMAGLMSRFGRGGDFLEAVQSMKGGGFDVSTANVLGSFAAQGAAGFGVGGVTGQGMLGMLGFGATGASGRLIAEQNMAGTGSLQTLLSGGKDNYQQARNLQIAMQVAPNAGIYAQDYLSRDLNLTNYADIAAGRGHVSSIARASGVTEDMVLQAGPKMISSIYDRIIRDPKGANSPMGRVMASMKSSGLDPTSWFQQSGMEGFSQNDAISGFAAALKGSGQASTEQSALGMARNIFGLGRGQGIGTEQFSDVTRGSAESGMAGTEIENMTELIHAANGEYVNLIKAMREAIPHFKALHAAATAGVGESSARALLEHRQILSGVTPTKAAIREYINTKTGRISYTEEEP